jgi:Terminase RNaseH-like domain
MKYTTVATWDDAPHLTKEMKDAYVEKIRTTEPHLLAVRAEGMPTFGAGLVWPCDLQQVQIAPFAIPDTYYRSYALDTGWNWNSVLFFAEDRTTGVAYVYDCFKRAQVEPPIVASAIQSRGKWIAGVGDAADRERRSGLQYIQIYKDLGLDIDLPNKALETGITQTWTALTTGQIRIFSTCTPLIDEMRIYMRDPKTGGIKEDQDDHLCDDLRYGKMSGFARGKQPPKQQFPHMDWENRRSLGQHGWMA